MLKYEQLSKEIEEQIIENSRKYKPENSFDEGRAIRRYDLQKDRPTAVRTAFIKDIDKILHCPYYNRYADKTQVFSFYKNDDISRRGLHVQLVSRIARTIGSALGLNLNLIEAIALGHDMGHTPFGHLGESYLDLLYSGNTGRRFSHNIHSVRVLDGIFPYNITLQTLNGIASHDGELELSKYEPRAMESFEEFDTAIEECYLHKEAVKKLIPSTLEGCVMRISDIIAYLGKDRQDAQRAGIIEEKAFQESYIGKHNAEIINNLIINIIENSYGKGYIQMDDAHFSALKQAKADNYEYIYKNSRVKKMLDENVCPMMENVYRKLYSDLQSGNTSSPIFTHHIDYVNAYSASYRRTLPYRETEANQIVVDYIASMTDDYFIDLHGFFFPKSSYKVEYKGYFD